LDIAEVVPHCTLARFLELLGVRQPGVFRFMRGDYNADPLPHSSIATPGTRIVFSDCSRHVTDSLVQTYDLPTVPLPVDKFVSHVTVDPRRPHDILLHKWRFLARPTNMEVVLILKSSTDVAATRDELHAMARVIDTHDHLIGGVLHSVLGNIEHSLLLTVVGATDLPAYAFGLFHLPNPTQDEILQHLHDVAATKRPPNSKYRLRFLSLDEYRRTLTPEQFALATIEDARDIPLRFSTYR
jgi:hypothetical protein